MHYNVYGVFYSQLSPQHVSATIAAIFRVMSLLQEYKGTNVVSCVAVTTQKIKNYNSVGYLYIMDLINASKMEH